MMRRSLSRRFGFVEVARLNEVGRKFDRYWDVAWLEKRLNEPSG
jgi:phosphinothricin acetyltransferase